MSDIAEYLASRLRELTPEKWDAFVRSLDQRFRVLEEQLGIERRVTDQILQRGLQVIEDGIGPAILEAEQAAANISAMTDLGLVFFSTSSTSLAINDNQKTLTIPAGNRAQFAPALYLAVFAQGSRENGFVGRRLSYNRSTGALRLEVSQIFGAGTFDAWDIGPIATTDDLEALRDQIIADKAATLAAREVAVTAAGQANGSASAANDAKNAAQAALTDFNKIWYGARDTEPAGAAVGSQYLDTSQTPNVVKVLQEDGWFPTVTVSVGGARQQVYVATEGQTGPFVVDGSFSVGSVNLNGLELFHGNGVALDPVAGTFTFSSPLSDGDLVVFRGYLANDLVDIYTKAEANDRFVRHDEGKTYVLGFSTGLTLKIDNTSYGTNWPIDISGTAAVATTANYAGSAGNASQLGGQPPSYYAAIADRLGYQPVREGTSHAITLGWVSPNRVSLKVNSTDFGYDWPINITGNAASVPNSVVHSAVAASAAGGVGSYALLKHFGSTAQIVQGAIVAGSELRFTSAFGSDGSGTPSGSWRCMGYINTGETGASQRTTLFVRVS